MFYQVCTILLLIIDENVSIVFLKLKRNDYYRFREKSRIPTVHFTKFNQFSVVFPCGRKNC